MIPKRQIKVWRWIKKLSLSFCGTIPVEEDDGVGEWIWIEPNEEEWTQYCDELLSKYRNMSVMEKYFYRQSNPIIDELLKDLKSVKGDD